MIELMGLKFNTEGKNEILRQIRERLSKSQKTFIVTPYSEFFYHSAKDFRFRDIINNADISLPDGISVVWLAHYLAIPLTKFGFYSKIVQSFLQMLYSLADILFLPKKIRDIIPEKIAGSDFFWDLAKLAHDSNMKIFLLGGFGQTVQQVVKIIKQKLPLIEIAGTSNIGPDDMNSVRNMDLIKQINHSGANMIFVAYGPVKQEYWISQNLDQLDPLLAIGVGGTFDYIAGKQRLAPDWMRRAGFEWLFRLITQPSRIKRIWRATYCFLRGAVRHKVFMSMPFRQNAVGVIINTENKVLVASRKNIREESQTKSKSVESHWQFPQGGINDHETDDLAVLREMKEELGTAKFRILGKASQQYTYTWPHYFRRLCFSSLKYKGQRQTIYFLKFEGTDSDIKVDGKEFDYYKWIDVNELKVVIHPFRQEMLKIVLQNIDEYL